MLVRLHSSEVCLLDYCTALLVASTTRLPHYLSQEGVAERHHGDGRGGGEGGSDRGGHILACLQLIVAVVDLVEVSGRCDVVGWWR